MVIYDCSIQWWLYCNASEPCFIQCFDSFGLVTGMASYHECSHKIWKEGIASSFPLTSPFPSFSQPFAALSLPSIHSSLIQLGDRGRGFCKLPQQVRAEPSCQTVLCNILYKSVHVGGLAFLQKGWSIVVCVIKGNFTNNAFVRSVISVMIF